MQLFSKSLRQFKHFTQHIHKSFFVVLVSVSACFSHAANASPDSDGDGLSDQYEESIGTEAFLSDTDGDGIKDGIEVGKNLSHPLNTDKDKRIDALDYDDDNDGLPSYLEGIEDSDNDGIANYLDTDSDNDGILDGIEAGMLNRDHNMDGIDDAFDSSRVGAIDRNGDDIDDNVKLPDQDNNGIVDFVDAKYQNMHISNNSKIAKKKVVSSKKRSAATTLKPDKKQKHTKQENSEPKRNKEKEKAAKKDIVSAKIRPNRYTDTDNDGLIDSQEAILGTNPRNRDSDDDKVSDAVEIGFDINSPQDSDHDGIIDALDPDDDNDTILTKFEDINQDNTAINDDTDGDGVPNYLDANDDGDNKLTRDEGGTRDTDNDGILDYLDKDDGHKDKAPEIIAKEVLDEPEVVVLFDGDEVALMNEAEDQTEAILVGTLETASIEEKNPAGLAQDKKNLVKVDQPQEKKTISRSKQAKAKSPWELF